MKDIEDNNHNELYSHVSTNHQNINTFTLPPRLETVIETMSEQSFQRSLLKSINNKSAFPNENEKENASIDDEKDEKIENLKMVMSIRKMFKEDANGKLIIIILYINICICYIDIINNKETFCVNKTSLKSLQKALLRRGKTQLSPIVERKKTYMEGESIDKKESLRKCVNNKFRKKYNKSKSVLG